jgi:MYXO-CTERM domain-containing protein
MVALEGPMTVMAGERASFVLRIARTDMGTLAGAGLDVAVSGGALRASAANTRVTNCELTHNAVIAPSAGASEVRIPFDFIAPPSSTTVTLRAAGNAVDGNGSIRGMPGQTGDQWAVAQVSITVTGSADGGGVCPEPMDASADGGADAQADTGADATATDAADEGSPLVDSSVDAAVTDASRDGSADGGVTPPPPQCACSTPGHRGRSPSVPLGALALAGALVLRRRRAG